MLTGNVPTRLCRACGARFEIDEFLPQTVVMFVQVCPECSAKNANREAAAMIERSKLQRAKRWKAICPPAYQATALARLPSRDLASRVLSWKYGPRGLLLHGHSGTGKSRCAWLILKREFEKGRTVGVVDFRSAIDYAAIASESARAGERWIENRSTRALLLLDDPVKGKLTDSYEAALFAIVARRTDQNLPILATLNDTGESLISRMSADRGEPLVRRLREFCDAIAFTVR